MTAPSDPYLRQGCNLVPDCTRPRDFKIVNVDGTRSDITVAHNDAVAYAHCAAKEFGIGPNREERFDAALGERAAEAKPDKLKGEVVSVNLDKRSFKLKATRGKESEVTANDATVIKKGKDLANFDEVVAVGTTLNVEVADSVALAITVKK